MKIFNRLIPICICLSLISCQSSSNKKNHAESDKILIKELYSIDGEKADKAALKIYLRGEAAIPFLLKISLDSNEYNGFFFVDWLSSSSLSISPNVGSVALCLIECIRRNITPNYNTTPLLIGEGENVFSLYDKENKKGAKTSKTTLQKASNAYKIWWSKNHKNMTTSPLKGTFIKWWGSNERK